MNIFKRFFSLGEDLNYRKGIEYFNTHQYDRAIEEFEKTMAKKPTRARLYHHLARFYAAQAHRNLGVVAFASGKFDEALAHFETSLGLNPEHVDLNLYIGICQNNLGNFNRAANALQASLAAFPDDMTTQMKLAVVYHNMKMWDKAISSCNALIEKYPNYADMHYRLGLALLCGGNSVEAARAFEDAIDINPNYVDARIKTGMAYAQQGAVETALSHFQTVVDRFPEYADVHYLMGLVFEKEDMLEEAMAAYERSLEVNPKYADPKANLSVLYVKKACYDKLLPLLESVADAASEDRAPQSAVNQIQKYLDAHTEDTAYVTQILKNILGDTKTIDTIISDACDRVDILPHFTEMISLTDVENNIRSAHQLSEILVPLFEDQVKQHPSYPDFHNSLGSLYVNLRRFDDAESAFKEAVSLNPNYIDARINLMKTLKIKNNLDEALIHGDFVISRGLDYPDVYLSVGEIQFALDRYDDALMNARKAIELKPSSVEAHYLNGQVLEKMERFQEALDAYEHCKTLDLSPILTKNTNDAIHRLKKELSG